MGILVLAGSPQPVRVADRDLNYAVSTQEWIVVARERYVHLDADHDTRLTLAEVVRALSAQPARR